jgi:hypothetical protein
VLRTILREWLLSLRPKEIELDKGPGFYPGVKSPWMNRMRL